MDKITMTRKFTSLLLLTVIISHLFVFHFELEAKVLCIGDGDHFHIETLHESHLENKLFSSITNDQSNIRNNNNCTDYLLDNHVDEDFARTVKINLYQFVQIVNLNLKESNSLKISNKLYSNRYINQKYVIEQLPTTLLLI